MCLCSRALRETHLQGCSAHWGGCFMGFAMALDFLFVVVVVEVIVVGCCWLLFVVGCCLLLFVVCWLFFILLLFLFLLSL